MLRERDGKEQALAAQRRAEAGARALGHRIDREGAAAAAAAAAAASRGLAEL